MTIMEFVIIYFVTCDELIIIFFYENRKILTLELNLWPVPSKEFYVILFHPLLPLICRFQNIFETEIE